MASFTKNAIKQSFIKLLNDRPLSKISVRDIVEDCGINRNSFYYHYQDIPTLLCELITEEAEKIAAKYPTPDSIEECVGACIDFALEHRRAIYHIYNSSNRDFYEQTLDKLCYTLISSYFDKLFGQYEIDPDDRALLIRTMSAECFGIIVHWMMRGMTDDIKKDFARICELRRGSVESMLRECMREK